MSASIRSKIYLILMFVSLIILIYSIKQIYPVIVEATDLFGLASLLPLTYWIGLAILVLTAIMVVFDHEIKSDAMFVFILVLLGLFLIGTGVFAFEAPRVPGSYFPSGNVKELIASHHIDIAENAEFYTYNSWPVMHFISASIVKVTGLELYEFIKYFPIFWVISFISITYSIGKRLRLPANYSFLLSLFVLSSYYSSWYVYNAQSIAILLYLLCFMFVLTSRNTPTESVLSIIIFSALLMTHSLAALATLLAVLVVSIYRKQMRLIVLFIVLFLSWYMFQASAMFASGVSSWLTAPFSNIFGIAKQIQEITIPAPPQRVILHYIQLSYPALYLCSGIAALVLLWKKQLSRENVRRILCCIAWLVGILGIGLFIATSPSISDILHRYYLYALIPGVCIILLAFRNRKLLVSLIVLFVALNIPAQYGTEAPWNQVDPTELKGAQFLAQQVRPRQPYFYNAAYTVSLVYFYNPELVTIPYRSPEWNFPNLAEPVFSVMDNTSYVIFGKQGHDRMMWSTGNDPMKDWTQTDTGLKSELIYNNGYFQVYRNNLIH